ncbi:MAG TPA: glycosyltransferase family 39 protein [Thermoflexales bacterium]|nr:glycosyltransferase family 39 protein [Thermoflexales bacterium]
MADPPLIPVRLRETRRWRAVVGAMLAAFVALATVYNLSLPAFEAPDEASHFYYAGTLLRTGALPEPVSGAPGDFRAQALHEAFQPPLYYALVAAAIAPFDLTELDAFVNRQNGDWYDLPGVSNLYSHWPAEAVRFPGPLAALRAARLVSTLLGALTLIGVIAIAGALLPGQRWTPLVAGALLAFSPKFLHMSASVSNDIAVTCAATLACAWMLTSARRSADNEIGRRGLTQGFVVGGLIAIAVLSKVGGIALLAPALVWAVWRAPRAALVRGLGVIFGLGLAGGAWFIRNTALYGDPLGWARAEAANAVTLRLAPLDAFAILASVPVWLQSLWGDLAIRQALPGWMDLFFWVVFAVGLSGLLLGLLRKRITASREIVVLAVWIAALLAGYVSWMRTHTATENGRLLMPAAGAFAAFITLGWMALGEALPLRARRIVGGALAVAVVIMGALAPALVLVPAYAPPPALTDTTVRAAFGLRPSELVFGGDVRLLHVAVEGRAVAPGEALPVSVYWGAERPIGRSLRAIVELIDPRGAVIGRVEAVPFGNRYSTTRWKPGEFFRDEYRVPVDAGAPRVVADVRVGVRDPYGQPEILRLDGTGQNRFTAGRVKVEGRAPDPGPPVGAPIDAVFGGQIRLRSVEAQIGTTITANLRFETVQAPAKDFTLFVHALDAAGQALGQTDGEPRNGEYPTSFWSAGEVIVETRALRLERPAARLVAGWYDRATGARLPVLRADGTPWADNMVILWEQRP